MGRKFFGVDVAKVLNKELGRGMKDATFAATLHRVTQGTETTGALTSGANPTETDHACKALVDGYADSAIDGTRILASDRRILILAESIAGGAVPQREDGLTIEGVRYRVVEVTRDPLGATYVVQGRA